MVTQTQEDRPEAGLPSRTGNTTALQVAVERMRAISNADIVALYPFDESSDSFYAPFAIGLRDADVIRALPDLADQLRRYRSDEAEGKIPDDLLPSHYGPNAWLIATRRSLVTTDAVHDVDGSFVRRHKIHTMIGLPLLVGDRLVGLLYLNYSRRKGVEVADPAFLTRIEQAGVKTALALDAARQAEEVNHLRAIADLASDFAVLSQDGGPEGGSHLLESALHSFLAAVQLDASALYAPDTGGSLLTLLAAQGCPGVETQAQTITQAALEELSTASNLTAALAQHDLHALTTLTPRTRDRQAVLVLADRDPLALQRRLPSAATTLQTAADLIGSVLSKGHLIDALGESNRTLGAITRLSTRLLQPGATKEQALRTAVTALTDPALPELDFEFAALYLLESLPDGSPAIAESAGATTSPAIDSLPAETDSSGHNARRVPRWVVTHGTRQLAAHDIVDYVAARRRAVVVAAREGAENVPFVTGYPEDGLERLAIPILRGDGSNAGQVRATRLRGAADRAPVRGEGDTAATYRLTDEITLDADIFAAHGHGSLVRVFVPFGTDGASGRASGVLEAGYHLSRKHRLERVQIEALRACAATVAVAVETARLYEDVTRRAEQLEIVTEVSRTIATSIDLQQTLDLVARNMARAVDASVCLIALLDEDESAWYGAASSDGEDIWRQRRVERPEESVVFEVTDGGQPIVVEDALNHPLVSPHMAHALGIRSLVALPLLAGEGGAIGAVILGERERERRFLPEEVARASGLASQAAMAIRNARLHAREEEEHHIQKDLVLLGFGQWGQKAYQHLVLLKKFFNFRTHIVEVDRPGRREQLADLIAEVLANGDLFYWDAPDSPAPGAPRVSARASLELELEPSCYVVTYIATPAETHLPLLKQYYDLSNVILIEKPLGAPPEQYREFLDRTDGSVQIIAADHYWFKIEVRLLQLLLTEERNLRAFLDEIDEIEIEILEEQAPGGSGAQIGMIADLIPHAFAVLSLLTPLDRLKLAQHRPLQIGCYQPKCSEFESYARLTGSFEHRGRDVRVTIDVGKGVANAKWIKLSDKRAMGGRRPFYKFDFSKGEAIDGTQGALRAAVRPIRQPGVPDNAHLTMLRHVIEKKHPAVGILSIHEALRANARIQELEHMAAELMAAGKAVPYTQGNRPAFGLEEVVDLAEARRAAHATHA